jgi:topoisomerase-4 subunit A
MAYVHSLFDKNFLEYASYVVKERAIPHINDGLKPVQRRILHTLHETDDGKFSKVANIVGHCMRYHPHGDASICEALVHLANKDLFIERQGNFGNIYTGDAASAARYIECRLTQLARETLFNPEITVYTPSYDGRHKEPVTLPAKIPVLLIQGAEGIAVGMSTRILPHNFTECLQACIAALNGEDRQLYPDFPTGGMIDVSEYNDGNGRVLVRAKLEIRDDKSIVITELPYGTTTQSVIASIEAAAKKNKIKIANIYDYTAEHVEIEIKPSRGVKAEDVIDGLYAFTDCEYAITTSCTLIKEGKPCTLSISEVLRYTSGELMGILRAELELELGQLHDTLHAKTLEQLFIENRIYKRIEDEKTEKGIYKAVRDGLAPFQDRIRREVTDDDITRLLRIHIRRISAYDIEKAQKQMREIEERIAQVRYHLANLRAYAVSFIQDIIDRYAQSRERTSEIVSFEKVSEKEAAQRTLKLRYDKTTGYLGHQVNATALFDVSPFDSVLVIKKSGLYSIIQVPDKLFVDKNMLYCNLMDEQHATQTVFTVVYKTAGDGYPYCKRCKIEKFKRNKGYPLVPDGATVLLLTTKQQGQFEVHYKPKPRVRVLREMFTIQDFLVKGPQARGNKLANKEVKKTVLLQD